MIEYSFSFSVGDAKIYLFSLASKIEREIGPKRTGWRENEELIGAKIVMV